MIEQNLAFYIFIVVVLMFFLVASISIPFYGFFRKRWRGLLVGCLVQPIVCCLACVMVVYGIYFYQSYDQRRHRKAAMVTLRKPGDIDHAHIWYLKANDECFYEYKDEKETNSRFTSSENVNLFDVIPLDSFRVSVDDIIIVRFDLKKHKVTAAEFDEPIEVVNVDWDRVDEYFNHQP